MGEKKRKINPNKGTEIEQTNKVTDKKTNQKTRKKVILFLKVILQKNEQIYLFSTNHLSK